jgi:hypothetical protein
VDRVRRSASERERYHRQVRVTASEWSDSGWASARTDCGRQREIPKHAATPANEMMSLHMC